MTSSGINANKLSALRSAWCRGGIITAQIKKKLLLNFYEVAVVDEQKKIIESPFRKMSFCLHFKIKTVYSICYRSVANGLKSVAGDGITLHLDIIYSVPKYRVRSVKNI